MKNLSLSLKGATQIFNINI